MRMSDGSIANIEIQKVPYDFPAERISCYSADLVLRQYKMLTGSKMKLNLKMIVMMGTIWGRKFLIRV